MMGVASLEGCRDISERNSARNNEAVWLGY